jgi:hypothetical protein
MLSVERIQGASQVGRMSLHIPRAVPSLLDLRNPHGKSLKPILALLRGPMENERMNTTTRLG